MDPLGEHDDVMVQLPPVATALPKTVEPSNNCTVKPASVVPEKAGVVIRVMLSVLDAPLSLAAVRSGVETAGGVVSIVTDNPAELPLVLPAGSVARAAML